MGGCKGPITTFIVEPFIPHNEEFYLNIVSDRLGNSISFSECGGIDIEENWDKVLQQIIFFVSQIEHYLCPECIQFSLIIPISYKVVCSYFRLRLYLFQRECLLHQKLLLHLLQPFPWR